MDDLDAYPFAVRRLTDDEGGGYLIEYLDFDGCLSDGETVEEAIANGRLALAATLEAMRHWGLAVPAPHAGKRKLIVAEEAGRYQLD